MNTPGPVALLGGHEHRRGTEAIERTLLEQLGVAAPRVAVLPVASAPRQVGMVAALARTYWAALGTSVRIATPDGNGSHHALDVVADADVIVLTGGVPNRLVSALGASPVWDLIVQRWREGAAIGGSSAGAMSLFAWRLRLYPPNPLALLPGLGPFDGWIAAPHFSRFRAEHWAALVTRRFGDLGVLGIDEATAIVGRQGRFDVVGRGTVTVVTGGGLTVHPTGTALDLDIHEPAPKPAGPPWAPTTRAVPSGRRLGHVVHSGHRVRLGTKGRSTELATASNP
jgi:cyanophycinase